MTLCGANCNSSSILCLFFPDADATIMDYSGHTYDYYLPKAPSELIICLHFILFFLVLVAVIESAKVIVLSVCVYFLVHIVSRILEIP